jgi:hypothetical protein
MLNLARLPFSTGLRLLYDWNAVKNGKNDPDYSYGRIQNHVGQFVLNDTGGAYGFFDQERTTGWLPAWQTEPA